MLDMGRHDCALRAGREPRRTSRLGGAVPVAGAGRSLSTASNRPAPTRPAIAFLARPPRGGLSVWRQRDLPRARRPVIALPRMHALALATSELTLTGRRTRSKSACTAAGGGSFHERPAASAGGRAADGTAALRHDRSEAEAVSSWLLRRRTRSLRGHRRPGTDLRRRVPRVDAWLYAYRVKPSGGLKLQLDAANRDDRRLRSAPVLDMSECPRPNEIAPPAVLATRFG